MEDNNLKNGAVNEWYSAKRRKFSPSVQLIELQGFHSFYSCRYGHECINLSDPCAVRALPKSMVRRPGIAVIILEFLPHTFDPWRILGHDMQHNGLCADALRHV
jgi:hypothetical protein